MCRQEGRTGALGVPAGDEGVVEAVAVDGAVGLDLHVAQSKPSINTCVRCAVCAVCAVCGVQCVRCVHTWLEMKSWAR